MSADPVRLQLGELLIHQGVLTEDQLEVALAEQRTSGAPLGEILVQHGFVKGPTVANALAEQHGGPLRTEYGLSIGPTHAVPRRVSELPDTREKDTVIAELRAALAKKTKEAAAVRAELSQLRRELATQRSPEQVPDDRHLLFVPGPEGYTMVERSRPAPEVGAAIELGATSFTVLKVGPSTLLGVPICCALLARSPTNTGP
jgi:hypothetical protein